MDLKLAIFSLGSPLSLVFTSQLFCSLRKMAVNFYGFQLVDSWMGFNVKESLNFIFGDTNSDQASDDMRI
jgi:hypothetical protein